MFTEYMPSDCIQIFLDWLHRGLLLLQELIRILLHHLVGRLLLGPLRRLTSASRFLFYDVHRMERRRLTLHAFFHFGMARKIEVACYLSPN